MNKPEPSLAQSVVIKLPDEELNPYKSLSTELRDAVLAGDTDRAVALWKMRNYIHDGK